ncbi:transketolase family protein [Neptuniibacter sp. SY11_33]|uniref:transketolase family protein n=1 Tax=Neptuniibacter sp. SY11_33 TaxID=3398215 RepID=UPI0039F5163E
MIAIDKRKARAWSRMGPRAVYGQFLLEMAREDGKVLALSADLGRSSGLSAFSKELPQQFFNTGIAEQNLVGISSGLARMEYKVFSSTFAPFASLRAGEQVRMNLGYMQEPVNLVALASGFALGFLGNSHFGIEDVAVMRAIPGITIVSPADCFEMYKCLNAAKELNSPVYIRLTGGVGMPVVYEEDYDYAIGKAEVLRPVERVTVIAHGTTVGHALKAVKAMEEDGLNVGLVNMHTIKPLDEGVLNQVFDKSDHVMVFEEHTVVGGLGSAILEFMNDNQRIGPVVHRYGVRDNFPKTGNYDYMLQTLGLDAAGIEASIRKVLVDA